MKDFTISIFNHMMSDIKVIGAGIVGLTVAQHLQSNGFSVTLLARHLPSDSITSTEWASPWAGAHWRPWSSNLDYELQAMEMETYREFQYLAQTAPESGIHQITAVDLFEGLEEDAPWYQSQVDNPRVIEPPEGIKYGLEYSGIVVDVPRYLVYLERLFRAKGGKIVQKKLKHISEAEGDVVVNCTGLGSRWLGGVEDTQMYPIRGQTVLVRAPHCRKTITRIGTNEISYVIPRGDGTVVLGGTKDRNSWDTQASSDTTQQILQRAQKLDPHGLSNPEVLSSQAGLRPARHGGVRLEYQMPLIHCYGHAGYGFQTSYGYAKRILDYLRMYLAKTSA